MLRESELLYGECSVFSRAPRNVAQEPNVRVRDGDRRRE